MRLIAVLLALFGILKMAQSEMTHAQKAEYMRVEKLIDAREKAQKQSKEAYNQLLGEAQISKDVVDQGQRIFNFQMVQVKSLTDDSNGRDGMSWTNACDKLGVNRNTQLKECEKVDKEAKNGKIKIKNEFADMNTYMKNMKDMMETVEPQYETYFEEYQTQNAVLIREVE